MFGLFLFMYLYFGHVFLLVIIYFILDMYLVGSYFIYLYLFLVMFL